MKFARKILQAVKRVADLWFLCALAERDATAADMALTALGDATFGDNQTQFGAAFGRGLLARMMKDEAKARARVCRDSSRTGEDRSGRSRISAPRYAFWR